MAKKTSSESIDETAFQALEDALKINFNDEQSRSRSMPQASEARVSDTPKQRQSPYQDDAGEAYRSAAAETTAKSPACAVGIGMARCASTASITVRPSVR